MKNDLNTQATMTRLSSPRRKAALHVALSMALGLGAWTTAHASAFPATSPSVGAGTSVAGNCQSTGGQIATPQNLSSASSNLNDAIKAAGQAINAQQVAQTNAFTNDLTALSRQEWTAIKAFVAAYEAARYTDDVTGPNQQPNATASGLPQGCAMSSLAGSVATGMSTTKVAQQQLQATVAKTVAPAPSHEAAVASAAKAASDAFSATSIMPPASSPVSPASAAAYIAMAVAPVPPTSVPASAHNTNAGQMALAQTNTLTARQSLAAETLSYIAAQHEATIDDTQAKQMWSNAGFSGNLPEDSASKISMDGLLQVMVNSRYANQNFYTALQDGGQAYALRTYAYELSAQLQIQQQQVAMLQRIVALNAAMLSAHATQANRQLDTLRSQAMVQTIKP